MYIETKIGPFSTGETITITAPEEHAYVKLGIEHLNSVSIKNATGIGERLDRTGEFGPTPPELVPSLAVTPPMSSFIIRENNAFDENYHKFFMNENDILEFSDITTITPVTSITIIPQQDCNEYTIITAGYKKIGG